MPETGFFLGLDDDTGRGEVGMLTETPFSSLVYLRGLPLFFFTGSDEDLSAKLTIKAEAGEGTAASAAPKYTAFAEFGLGIAFGLRLGTTELPPGLGLEFKLGLELGLGLGITEKACVAGL